MRGTIQRECLLLTIIAVLIGLLFYGLPLWQITIGSLYGTSGLSEVGDFIGIANYTAGWRDPALAQALLASAALTLPSVILQVGLAFGAALLTRRHFLAAGALRWMFMVPYFLPTVVVVVAWRFFSDPFVGLLPAAIRWFGFATPDLRGPLAALPAMVLVATYEAFPFTYVVLLARMLQIPSSLYEVAQLSGAGPGRVFRAVTWPQVRLTLSGLLLLRILITWLKFDVPWLVYASQAPSPLGDTLAVAIYRIAFERLQRGQAYAVSLSFLSIAWASYALWSVLSQATVSGGASKSLILSPDSR